MGRVTICAGNWKLNMGPVETREFLQQFKNSVPSEKQSQYLVFPQTPCLALASELLKDTEFGWGAQNIYSEKSGAFTGETSAQVVKELGATHCLVGHSERRSLFGETNGHVADKSALCQNLGLTPVVCVGETLAERDAGRTANVVSEQVKLGLAKIDPKKNFLVAYEPVWAIGTGKVASPDQAEEVHALVRMVLTEMFGANISQGVSLLYGGSVKPENSSELSSKDNVDGFLVGGASLKVDSFLAIGGSIV